MDGIGIAAVSVGVIFAWGGIKGYSPLKAAENAIQGKHPNEGQTTASLTIANQLSNAGFGNQPGNVSGNRALGQMMAAARGWTGADWIALDNLWTRESGWNEHAENPSSGAYGIPQALPPTKMPANAQKAGGSNASAQIAWGLQDIANMYGSPSEAWAHEQQFGWY